MSRYFQNLLFKLRFKNQLILREVS
ncbi:hypothetical protein F383_18342 [Gossypium arboreum]|uniref:Uncharacterized protein n=1 Tax=Gossypium arboreum TaxID=29729 RepID=A0A0B0NDC9_GOSAR|nr:hypothetical protein F383_18342 [Gossypium arboreum]